MLVIDMTKDINFSPLDISILNSVAHTAWSAKIIVQLNYHWSGSSVG